MASSGVRTIETTPHAVKSSVLKSTSSRLSIDQRMSRAIIRSLGALSRALHRFAARVRRIVRAVLAAAGKMPGTEASSEVNA